MGALLNRTYLDREYSNSKIDLARDEHRMFVYGGNRSRQHERSWIGLSYTRGRRVCKSEFKRLVLSRGGVWLFQDTVSLEKRGCRGRQQPVYKWGRLNDRGGGMREAQG